MSLAAPNELQQVHITKIVNGGQGLGELPDGRKVFVWNALPDETVLVRVLKSKKSYAEAIAEEIIKPSPDRTVPLDDNYLATSPWQIVNFAAENEYKKSIVNELFAHEHISHPELGPIIHDEREWNYRNKMEYSFWGDDSGLHLALHQRGSHGKQIVTGSSLAMPAIDAAANSIVQQLTELETRAGDLKTVILRCDQQGNTVAALFTKLTKFTKLKLPNELLGLRVYHSNPKSPASVATSLIYELGDCRLQDQLLGNTFTYDVDSFFQVNPPLFVQALTAIKVACVAPTITDLYSGVGTIGLSVASNQVRLVELDAVTAAMAKLNAAASTLKTEVVHKSVEESLEFISASMPLIVDPPRAGLHPKVTQQILDAKPSKVVYLSCNPATQARDLARIQASYKVSYIQLFNFFPKTPHIESLAILTLL